VLALSCKKPAAFVGSTAVHGHNLESTKFINPQELSSALASLVCYSPCLQVYKFIHSSLCPKEYYINS